MHRVFAVFIWASTWEKTSRTNLFVYVKTGGLGLAHLYLRPVSSRLMFIRDQSHPFLRTVIPGCLQRLLPVRIVSCENIRGAVTVYSREVVLSCKILEVSFSSEYLCKVNKESCRKLLLT